MAARAQGQNIGVRRLRQLKEAFLKHFEERGIITRAAEAAGVDRSTIYRWQEHDPEFAVAMQQANLRATDVIEDEIYRRAVDGVDTPRTVAGGREMVKEYSDTLLIFLAKARNPARFNDRLVASPTANPTAESPQLDQDALEQALNTLPEDIQGMVVDALADIYRVRHRGHDPSA